jgi:hypothetical protein
MYLLLVIIERIYICYWTYWTENASIAGHTGESMHLLLAIQYRVRICCRPYCTEYACVKGNTGNIMLVTDQTEESLNL